MKKNMGNENVSIMDKSISTGTIHRRSNIELLRVVCMLMIVAGHIIQNHVTVFSCANGETILKLFFMSFFSVAVNSFILISGYFGIKFSLERLLKLLFQSFFYSVLLMSVSYVLGWHDFNLRKDLFAFFPILTKQYWFVTCYVVLYVISPWLNLFVNSLNKTQYQQFLLIALLLFYLWPTISFLFNAPQFIGDSGYGIVNFICLYLLGRYLRLFFVDSYSSFFYFNMYSLLAVLLFLCQYGASWFLGFEFTSWFSYNTIFILGASICLFLAFKNLKFNSRIVNFWAKPCLAVYLIHMNHYTWGGFCKVIGLSQLHGWQYLGAVLCLPIIIYLFCALIEMLRMASFRNVEAIVISKIERLNLMNMLVFIQGKRGRE